jgi:carbamoyltransferase
VRAPEEAMGTQLDVLAVGNLYLQKSDQNAASKHDYKNAFELD